MQLDINELYKVLSDYMRQAIRDNFQYDIMDVFGNDEIQLTLEDGKMVNIYLNIESEEDF